MFHDIGKKEIDRELLEKTRPLLTHAERILVESHTERGREIMLALKAVPDDIAQVAFQHHENCLGHGYPAGIERAKIHPLARLIGVANIFCNNAIKNELGDGIGGPMAIQKMEIDHRTSLDWEYFRALKGLFSH